MDKKERDRKIAKIGKALAKLLPEFFGSVKFNIKNGRYVNCNLNECVQSQK